MSETTDVKNTPAEERAKVIGQRAGRAASSAVTETAFALVGLGAYATDLVRSMRATPQAMRAVGDWTVRGASTVGTQITVGFQQLSRRGHRVLGVAPRSRTPQTQAAEAGANVARKAADTMLDGATTAEGAADRLEAEAYEAMTLTELRERAREADVVGRSNMSREQLIAALTSRST